MSSRARLVRSRHGTLAIRFHWQGRPVWEGTGVVDQPGKEREALQAICDRISDELRRGVFDRQRYLAYFPEGNRAAVLRAPAPSAPIPTVRDYAAEWIERQRVERGRGTWDTYRHQITGGVLDVELPDGVIFGNLRLDEITRRRLIQLRAHLLGRLKVSSAKNILAGGFRSMMNAARADELIVNDPFAGMPRWPRQQEGQPDPFTREERDRLIGWFDATRWGAFVFLLFHSGMRPSEAVALLRSDVDLESGACRITKSRVLGEVGPPKTAGSVRTIRLAVPILERLRAERPLRADPDGYLFTRPSGAPIEQKLFAQADWAAALTAVKMRPRKFYATRHTFLSVGVSLGRNFKWLATYCGTSARMIERHYAIFLPASDADQLDALVTEAERSQLAARQVPQNARVGTDLSSSAAGGPKSRK